MRPVLAVAALASALAAAAAASVPHQIPWKSWKFCKEVKPCENNKCLCKAIESAVKNDLAKGNCYFGTPSVDPLEIPELTIFNQGQNKAVAINLTFRNGTIDGLSKFIMKSVKTDWSKGYISSNVTFPEPITFTAWYELKGQVILLPISGKGNATFVFDEMNATLTGDFMTIEKNNKKYFTPRALLPYDIKPKKLTMKFENLFGGNKILNDLMNNFLNGNWEVFFEEVGPFIAEGLKKSFTKITNNVLHKVPIEVMVPK